MITHREQRVAETLAYRLPGVLTRRGLKAPIRQFLLSEVNGLKMLIAEVDLGGVNYPERYTTPEVLSHLRLEMGVPVYLSQVKGLRYVLLLSPLPQMPRRVELPPDVPSGQFAVGVGVSGRGLSLAWEDLQHLAVLGATGSGKSVFLQSLVWQGLRDGLRLLLSDIEGVTFGMLADHPGLLAPVAETPAGALERVEQALAECERRAKLLREAPGHPQNLKQYNERIQTEGGEALPRILVIVDEASAVLSAMGRGRGELGEALANLGWRGRKYGVHFVFAAQEFTKELLGPVRDQVGMAVCFRVRSAYLATHMGCRGAERIPVDRPGLAITDRWGPVQTYYLDAGRLEQGKEGLQVPVSEAERGWFLQALKAGGRLSRSNLMAWSGMSEWQARKNLEAWAMRGWVMKEPQEDNAFVVTEKMREWLSNPPTSPACSNHSNLIEA